MTTATSRYVTTRTVDSWIFESATGVGAEMATGLRDSLYWPRGRLSNETRPLPSTDFDDREAVRIGEASATLRPAFRTERPWSGRSGRREGPGSSKTPFSVGVQACWPRFTTSAPWIFTDSARYVTGEAWSAVLYRTALAAVHQTWLAPTWELRTMLSSPVPALNVACWTSAGVDRVVVQVHVFDRRSVGDSEAHRVGRRARHVDRPVGRVDVVQPAHEARLDSRRRRRVRR